MRVLLVAATTGYQTRSFAGAAQKIGCDLVLATDRCHILDDPWGDSAIAVRFDDPSEGIDTILARGPFDGIAAVGDQPSYIAALAAEKLGLPFHSQSSVAAAKNKFLAREKFREAGLLTPCYQLWPAAIMEPRPTGAVNAEVRIQARDGGVLKRPAYPCVLKPLGLSGSRGVIRADNDAEFAAAFGRVQTISSETNVLVEDFIPGHEFALEGVVANGRLRALALFDKPDPLDGPFFEETIYVTVAMDDAIVETTQRAVAALGLTDGPIHAEMRVNHEGVWMLEVAARPIGGLCSRVLRFSGGASLEELILRHALGENIETVLEPGSHAVMMIPIPHAGIYVRTDGVSDAKAGEYIDAIVITAKPGQEMIPLPEGASYLGFIFARAATPELAVDALRAAHARLKFQFAATLPVVR